jgi:hypothetical protein
VAPEGQCPSYHVHAFMPRGIHHDNLDNSMGSEHHEHAYCAIVWGGGGDGTVWRRAVRSDSRSREEVAAHLGGTQNRLPREIRAVRPVAFCVRRVCPDVCTTSSAQLQAMVLQGFACALCITGTT